MILLKNVDFWVLPWGVLDRTVSISSLLGCLVSNGRQAPPEASYLRRFCHIVVVGASARPWSSGVMSSDKLWAMYGGNKVEVEHVTRWGDEVMEVVVVIGDDVGGNPVPYHRIGAGWWRRRQV